MATYYIVIDTFWEPSPDRFVGSFESRTAAQAEINRATTAEHSKVVLAGQNPADIRNSIRVHGILSKSGAQCIGLKDFALGDSDSNVIGTQIPIDIAELRVIENAIQQ